ncbi:hypothetical protein HYT32_00545 [Candidatus Roizmanbacteria bacterium]|nr:hypothetical protein [Candidatus Roizmanbacteria bacterium]
MSQERESGQPFQPNEALRLRREVFDIAGVFDDEARRVALEEAITPFLRKTLLMLDNPIQVSGALEVSRESLIITESKIPSPTRIAANSLRLESLFLVRDVPDIVSFLLRLEAMEYAKIASGMIDFSYGILYAGKTIMDAEDSIRGSISQKAREFLAHRESISATEEAELFAQITTFASQNSDLLRKDPTGASIIESLIPKLGQTPSIGDVPAYFDRELVIEGLKFARNMHKIVYPLAETLQPAN